MTALPARAARLHPTEFIAMIAALFAMIAFSIDAMLPALPQIAAELTPDNPNRAQLILSSFVLGMGFGTFFAGPLSDAFGRKPVILGGVALYMLATLVAWRAQSLEAMLIARVVMGVGVAGPRIVTMAMVRDLHAGREMARVVSFAMMIFTLVPAVAPAIGALIIDAAGWRAVFPAFILFAAVGALWFGLRQPETLALPDRRPLQLGPLLAALREVLSHRIIVIATIVQTLVFGALFGTLSSTQAVFDQTFGQADSFPFWFAMIALMSGTASFINAALVVRLGMRVMITVTLLVQIVLSVTMAGVTLAGLWPEGWYFAAFVLWNTSVFMMAGLTIGNLNALALEPVGHIAGMAASITTAVATVVSVGLAVPLGLMFDGTPVPLAIGVAVLAVFAAALMISLPARTKA